MSNITTRATNTQEKDEKQNVNFHALDMVSLNALVPFTSAVLMLSDKPIYALSYFHRFLDYLYEQKREQDCLDVLVLIYNILGIEYADAMTQLRTHPEARNNFLYGYIANIGELIEEIIE